MMKEHEPIIKKLLLCFDLLLIAVAFFIGYYFRSHLEQFLEIESIRPIYALPTYYQLLPPILFCWFVSLYAMGAYETLRGKYAAQLLMDVLKASVLATVIFGSFAFLFRLHYISRFLITIIFFLAWLFLSAERIVLLNYLDRLRKKGYYIRYLMVVGTGKRAQQFIELIHQNPEWGYKITGLVDDEPSMRGKQVMGYRVLGLLRDLPGLLEKHVVDEIVYIVPRQWLGRIEDSILYCETLGKRVSVAVDLFNLKFAKAKQRVLQNFPLLTFETTSDRLWQLLMKRILDLGISAAALIVLAPFLLFMIVLIRVSSNGPAIFSQTRCTLNGRTFTVYKFRTMVMDAEKKLESLKKYNEMKGPAFKMTHDPRIIKCGRWIRKFSIDELPQLINVLKGDMSLIGPRPPIPAEVKKYEPWQRRRLSMRPGLTCLWQIQGRNKIVKFDEWMKLDLEYIDRWSLWLDFKIFLKTIPVVLFGIGAK